MNLYNDDDDFENRFATVEMFVAVVELLTRYKVVVDDDENLVKPVYGFVTKPEREVWVRLLHRR